MPDAPLDVLVVGAGQAGLALGHELCGTGLRFALLEGAPRVGDSWRSRWDSLRLFTAAEYSSLPGLPFPAPAGTHPGRDDVADYLEAYAATFALPVRTRTPVTRLTRDDGAFTAHTPGGPVRARQVVVAVGPHSRPHVPAFAAAGLAEEVRQLHSAGYRRPDDVPAEPVLVVGAGNSGLQIAAELAAAGRDVTVAVGSTPRPVPQRPLGRELFWWLDRSGVLRLPTSGRLAHRLHGRELAVGTSWRRLRELGIRLRGRAMAASGTTVHLADGPVQVGAVLWATGYRSDFSWIDVPGAVAGGAPVHRAGVSAVPGLAFLGLPWQRTRGSALLGFVGADAAWLARRLTAAA